MLFRPSFPVFTAIGEALGLLEADAATTEFEVGPVRPRLDVGIALQKSAVWRTFIFAHTAGAGAETTTTLLDFYTVTNWDAIEVANRDSLAFLVPPRHECIVIGVGARASSNANIDSVSIQRRRTAVIGLLSQALFWGDESDFTLIMTRGTAHADPVLTPLPWYFPPLGIQDAKLSVTVDSSNAVTVLTTFDVLSAPVGVFPRLR